MKLKFISLIFCCLFMFLNSSFASGISFSDYNSEYNPILIDKDEFMILGGITEHRHVKNIDYPKIFNLKTKKVTELSYGMNIPRNSYSAAKINEREVLILGGYDESPAPQFHIKTAEIFDIETKCFRKVSDTNFVHYKANIIPMSDGRVFIISGDTPEIYDPKTEKFSIVGTKKEGSIIDFSINKPRKFSYYTLNPYAVSKALRLQDGRILVIGARPYRQNEKSTYYNNAEIYNPKTNNFEKIGQMKHQRYDPTMTLLPDGKVLICGGTVRASGYGTASAEIYDPKNDQFSTTGNLNQARYNHSAILLNNGKVLVLNGEYGHSEDHRYLRLVEIYDPNTSKFKKAGKTRYTRTSNSSISLLKDNQVLVIGSGTVEILKPYKSFAGGSMTF